MGLPKPDLMQTDPKAGDYVKGKEEFLKQVTPEVGGKPEDGFSPIATVTQTATGATINITDKNGSTTATITNGKDGKDGSPGTDGKDGSPGKDGEPGKDGADGQPGKDGTSPVVAVSAITGGNRITITDKNGAKTVDVMHGKNGSDGKPGADGSPGKDGSNGRDGYTPVKGKDYFTDAEKTEMVNAVKAALPIYAGEVAAV